MSSGQCPTTKHIGEVYFIFSIYSLIYQFQIKFHLLEGNPVVATVEII